jgi:hypothetical protein
VVDVLEQQGLNSVNELHLSECLLQFLVVTEVHVMPFYEGVLVGNVLNNVHVSAAKEI